MCLSAPLDAPEGIMGVMDMGWLGGREEGVVRGPNSLLSPSEFWGIQTIAKEAMG